MKIIKFVPIYSTCEDCNCNLSHDTSEEEMIFDSLKEAIEYGNEMIGNPHDHTTMEFVNIEKIIVDKDGNFIDTGENFETIPVWSREWDRERKEYREKVFN